MSTTATDLLPPGFEQLAPLVAEWALPTEQQRNTQRMATPLPALRAFYDTIFPQMDRVMDFLATQPAGDLSALPAPVLNLYRLALSYMEASHPIELRWKNVDLDDAFPYQRIEYQEPSSIEN